MKATTQKPVEKVNNGKLAFSYLRFSTPEQRLGDSERRQLDGNKALCQQHGWQLSDLSYADRGVSAFRGKNRKQGAMKELLGTVKPGNVIIIENIDRWGRDCSLDSVPHLRDVVQTGLEFYFKNEGVHVTRESMETPQVRIMLVYAAERANGESMRKQRMANDTWKGKREAIKAGRVTRLSLPCWLTWDAQANKPVLDAGKTSVVRKLFALAGQGHGVLEIVRRMRGTPPITNYPGATWNTFFVRRTLSSRAALGFCQLVDPPALIWPPIVSEAEFYGAQTRLKSARKYTRRLGRESNLLLGLAVCPKCGHGLVAHTSRNHNRLLCGAARSGQTDCGHQGAPIALIETSLFAFLSDADFIRPLLAADQKPTRMDELQGKAADIQKQVDKAASVFWSADVPQEIADKLAALKAEQKAIKAEQEQVKAESSTPALESYEHFRATLASRLGDASARGELRRAVNSIIERITLDPAGVKQNGARRWRYTVQLRGHGEPIQVDAVRDPSKIDSWCFRSLRPALCQHRGQNVLIVPAYL